MPRTTDEIDVNADPITGEPGSHPVGTGLGAAGGATAGAAVGGAVGGPAGAVVGGAVGAVAGGLAGKGAAEVVNPTVEDAYWRENYRLRPYVDTSKPYDYYEPAYRYGWESRSRYMDRRFEDLENDLQSGWDRFKGNSRLAWHEAKDAVRDSWHHVERTIPGDFDRDNR